jgi:hypothetical protein
MPPDEGRPAPGEERATQIDASAGRSTDISIPTGPLRELLEQEAAEHGVPLKDLTVLAVQHDPFRVDTPASHRDGEWLATHVERLVGADRTIHLRGLHYALVTDETTKPNGARYRNTDADWRWLQEKAADAARWLRGSRIMAHARGVSLCAPRLTDPFRPLLPGDPLGEPSQVATTAQGGGGATVIAWLWARTITCSNPACGTRTPLLNSFIAARGRGHVGS